MKTSWPLVIVCALIAMVIGPWLISDFWIFIVIQVMVYALYAVAFNLLLGYGGMLPFGFATFFGLGAYALAVLQVKLGVGITLAALAAPFVSAMFGGLIAYFCIRLSGIYFGMLTFAFQMLAYAFFLKSYYFAGGDSGLHGIVIPGFLGQPVGLYYLTLGTTGLGIAALWRIVQSPFGLALRSQSNNPRKSLAIGINVSLHRWLAFTIAAFFAGLSGALSALANQSVFPDWLDWRASAVPIMMTILGGIQSFVGPIIGSAIFVLLQTVLTGMTQYWALFMGILIIAIVVLMPKGVIALFERSDG